MIFILRVFNLIIGILSMPLFLLTGLLAYLPGYDIERKIEGKKVPRMLVVHISDLYHKHKADNIYPVHFIEVYKGYMPVTGDSSSRRIYFHGTDSADLYLIPDTIIYAESIDYGRHSMLYTINGAFRTSVSITTLENEHPEFLLRCHKCHLVNPAHIIGISRFKVTLSNGQELAIPEKKYTAFRKAVHERWEDTAKAKNT